MIRIGILGYSGRMGQLIADEIAASDKCVLAGGLVREIKPGFKQPEGVLITSKPDELIAISDVVIDFTTADVTVGFAEIAVAHGKPFMSGTTGLDKTHYRRLGELSTKIPLLIASNTSFSLIVAKRLTQLATKLFTGSDYDVAIIDEHHRHKKDSPSGTAKTLGAVVESESQGEKTPQYASIRAGSIVGEHQVIFAGQGETVRIHHSVTDRRVFARGALQAALWLYGKKPDFYQMDDVLPMGFGVVHFE